jgi:hypothetical protein
VDYSFRWGEEGDARLKVGLRLCGERGVDEEPWRPRLQAVVLSPGLLSPGRSRGGIRVARCRIAAELSTVRATATGSNRSSPVGSGASIS